MQPNKLSLVSLVAGAVMFLLPWLDFQCQGRTLIRQSGLQAAVGLASAGEDFKKAPAAVEKKGEKPGPGAGVLVLASGVLLGIALWGAWRQVKEDTHDPVKIGRYAGIALGLVCLQMAIGFPVERAIKDEMKKNAGNAANDPFQAAMQKQIGGAFQTKYLPALYLYLAALAVPTVMWLTSASREQRRGSESTSNAS